MAIFRCLKKTLVRAVEDNILGQAGLKAVYSRTVSGNSPGTQLPADVIGVIQLELEDWQVRPPAAEIIPALRSAANDIAGIQVQVQKQENGPGAGKPINLELAGLDLGQIERAVGQIRAELEQIEGLTDIEDSRPLPSIEWRLEVNREQAARYGANVSLLGSSVQMVTGGILLTDYRPNDSDEEIEVRLRFPEAQRNMEQLSQLRVPTALGSVPVENFVTLVPAAKTGQIERSDTQRIMTIDANVQDGVLPADILTDIQDRLSGLDLPAGVTLSFKGENEDQPRRARF